MAQRPLPDDVTYDADLFQHLYFETAEEIAARLQAVQAVRVRYSIPRERAADLAALWNYASGELIAALLRKGTLRSLDAQNTLFARFWAYLTQLIPAFHLWQEQHPAVPPRPVAEFLASASVPHFRLSLRNQTKQKDWNTYEQATEAYRRLAQHLRSTLKRRYRNPAKKTLDVKQACADFFQDGYTPSEQKLTRWTPFAASDIALRAIADRYGIGWQQLKKIASHAHTRTMARLLVGTIPTERRVITPPTGPVQTGSSYRSIDRNAPDILLLYEKWLRLRLQCREHCT